MDFDEFHVFIDFSEIEVLEVTHSVFTMSNVDEIEAAIARLPKDAFWKLTDRLIERRETEWDAQVEADAKAGRLDALWAEAEKEIEAGETTSLDAFLDNKSL